MDAGFAGERDSPSDRGLPRRAEKAADRGRALGRRVADVAIDRWLQASLRSQFDAVIAEPIPEALARAILGDAGDCRASGGCPTKMMLTAALRPGRRGPG